MPEGELVLDGVVVTSTNPVAQYVAFLDQVRDDLVSGPLSNTDCSGNVPQANAGVMRNAE